MVVAPGAQAPVPLAQIEAILHGVADPEIPVVSIHELGILRAFAWVLDAAGQPLLEVVLTPTYSACPAVAQIQQDIETALARLGVACIVKLQLAPAWSSNWITAPAREKLRAWGVAPPEPSQPQVIRFARPAPKSGHDCERARPVPDRVHCPQCGSADTTETSYFGSTACKAMYRCLNCLEPFDYFKPH